MAIGGNLPKHLEVSAKTGVLHSPARDDMPYRRVAMEVVQDAKEGIFVDLGGMPIPSQNAKVVEDMIEKSKTVWVAARQFVDDQGNYNNFNYDLIVTHPTNAKAAAQIAENQEEAGTTDRNLNPFAGKVGYITVPEFDTTAWVLVASGEPTKPVFVAIRKRPTLLNIWFDSQTGDGGMHYFQYHGRYTVDYGDWPTAVMGNS